MNNEQQAGFPSNNNPDKETDYEQVVNAVTSGVGVMPAFEESLPEAQIQAVARYVSGVTGGSQ